MCFAGGAVLCHGVKNIICWKFGLKQHHWNFRGGSRKILKINAFQSTAGTNNEKGIGFGLLLCKEFIELHIGNIRIESASGNGSEFKYTLCRIICKKRLLLNVSLSKWLWHIDDKNSDHTWNFTLCKKYRVFFCTHTILITSGQDYRDKNWISLKNLTFISEPS